MKLKEILERINIFGKEDEYFDDEIDEKLDGEEAKNTGFLKKFNKRVIAAMIAAALLISAVAGVTGVRHVMAQA